MAKMHYMMVRVATQFAKSKMEMYQLYWILGEHFLPLIESGEIKNGPYLEQCMQKLVVELSRLKPFEREGAFDIIKTNRLYTIQQSKFIQSIYEKPIRSSI